MQLAEGVDEGIGKVIKDTIALVRGRGATRGPESHVGVPVRGFEEDGKEGAATEDGMERQTLQKAVQ